MFAENEIGRDSREGRLGGQMQRLSTAIGPSLGRGRYPDPPYFFASNEANKSFRINKSIREKNKNEPN